MSKQERPSHRRLLVGVLGSLVALGVFGLFSATTQNRATNEAPAPWCWRTTTRAPRSSTSPERTPVTLDPLHQKATYNGSLPAFVHLYMENTTVSCANIWT